MANGKPELLAPAGGRPQLEYAIRYGADAVYLAADKYGMRQHASNFDLASLRGAVSYAHRHGVKVYVACNVMMREGDLDDLPAYFEELDDMGADAVIVGDMGALKLARRHAPHAALHVSTQASVSNSEAALTWMELGADRIICARESSLADVAAMREKLPRELELECFVHGSMCMAYSGRCIVSDYLAGRSGMTGNCAQPCRWRYSLVEETRPGQYFPVEEDSRGSYLLNSQDLNMIEHVDALIAAGVDSFKIEGRNKKAYYVATVVNAYRKAIDGEPVEALAEELECVAHRPYSTGFYYGMAHQAVESARRTSSCSFAGSVASSYMRDDGLCESVVRVRNAFERTDAIEVLSPGELGRKVELLELALLPQDEFGCFLPEEPCERANRTMELYRVTTREPLAEGDLLRRRL